jgi:proliferating cell nuclear antigen
MDIDADTLGIPDTEYDASVTMPSSEFSRIVRDLSGLGESVKIEVSKDGVRFTAEGESANGNILLKQTESARRRFQNVGKRKKQKEDEDEDAEDDNDSDSEKKKKKKKSAKEEVKKEENGDVDMTNEEGQEDGEEEFQAKSDDESDEEQKSKKRKKAPTKVCYNSK